MDILTFCKIAKLIVVSAGLLFVVFAFTRKRDE